MIKLDQRKFMLSALGAVGIITAVVIKNSLEQMKMPDHPFSQFGGFLFVASWMLMAYSVATGYKDFGFPVNMRSFLAYLAPVGILAAVGQLKSMMKRGASDAEITPYRYLFIGSWLLFGVVIGMGHSNLHTMLGVAGALAVIMSMMYTLPLQRKMCVVDGPGAYLFALGWVLIVFGNSLRL